MWKTRVPSLIVLALVLLLVPGCSLMLRDAPPRADEELEITAPLDGDIVFVGQSVRVAVHLHNEEPAAAGTLYVEGPDGRESFDLTFITYGSGEYAAHAIWAPQAEGTYTLKARAPLIGWTAHSAAIKVQAISPRPMQQAPALAGRVVPRPTLGALTPTATPLPKASPTPTPTTTPSPTPLPCYRAAFVADVTVPDGTELEPGQAFVKTWRLRNTGSCPWGPDVAVIFDSGDRMGAADRTPIEVTVPPGQEADVSVSLRAPDQPGTFRANFKLQAPDGTVFGLGEGQGPFYVEIVVPAPRMPDLIVETVTFDPATPVEGQGFTVYMTVRNIGDAASGPFAVAWYSTPQAHVAYCYANVSNLNPGERATVSCPAGTPEHGLLPAGQYTTVTEVDPGNQVRERDEGNNALTAALTIVAGDTQGPAIVKVSRTHDRIYWPAMCTPHEVTFTVAVQDDSGVAWVRLLYRVVNETNQAGQWAQKDFHPEGTNTWRATLTAADLPASLSPPLHYGQGRVELRIVAADTLSNQSQQDQAPLLLLYCLP